MHRIALLHLSLTIEMKSVRWTSVSSSEEFPLAFKEFLLSHAVHRIAIRNSIAYGDLWINALQNALSLIALLRCWKLNTCNWRLQYFIQFPRSKTIELSRCYVSIDIYMFVLLLNLIPISPKRMQFEQFEQFPSCCLCPAAPARRAG